MLRSGQREYRDAQTLEPWPWEKVEDRIELDPRFALSLRTVKPGVRR